MRRLVVALVMAALVLSLTACGGGEAESAATEEPAAAAPAAAAPAAAAAAVPVSATNRLTPSEPGTGQPFPTGSSAVPKVILDKLAEKKPMVVFFYDPEQNTTRDQRLEIEEAMREYRGLIELIELDVTAALPDPSKKATAEAEQTALLVQELKVGFTPYTILVDKQGMMTGRFRGYIDRALLDREILRATQ